MPLYDGIGLISEKHAVVIDLGSAYTKCGFAGETGPRCIVPTEMRDKKTNKVVKIYDLEQPDELYNGLCQFINHLYFKYLLVNPKDRRVVVVESVMSKTSFRETLAKVMFNYFEVSSLLLVPAHLMSLFTLGLSTALVLDVGYEEALAIPICEGVVMVNSSHSVPFAGKAIHKNLEDLLMKSGKVKKDTSDEKPIADVIDFLEEQILEDIKVRSCFVTKLERAEKIHQAKINNQPEKEPVPPHGLEYPMGGDHIIIIPGYIREQAAEIMFEQDSEQISMATIILDTILKCSLDARKQMAENIVIMGGTSMLPGFKHRLMTELHSLVKSEGKYKEQLAIRTFKFHQPPAKENYVAWLGAAIFGATDAITTRAVSKEQYQQQGCLSDWSNLTHQLSQMEKSM